MTTVIDTNSTASLASINDQLCQAFPFTVEKYRLSGPDNMRTDWYGLFRSDNMRPIGPGSVSARYSPHQTDDVIEVVMAAATAFDGEMKLSCAFDEGHYVVMNPTDEERRAIFGTKDNIYPRLIVHAGYGGKAFHASLGIYRDTCRNLARFKTISACSTSIRHTKSMGWKLDDLVASFRRLRESWFTVADIAAKMQSMTCDLNEFLASVYDDQEKTKHTVKRDGSILQRLMNERRATDRPFLGSSRIVSVWEAFNAVQGHQQHGVTRKGIGHDPLARALVALEDATVSRAEVAALALIA